MEVKTIHKDYCEYGNVGWKVGFIHNVTEINKFLVIIVDNMDNSSIYKLFDNLDKAIDYYDDELSIITDRNDDSPS